MPKLPISEMLVCKPVWDTLLCQQEHTTSTVHLWGVELLSTDLQGYGVEIW